MPKILLTNKQRQEERVRRFINLIRDGLCVTRCRNHISLAELANAAGVSRNTMAKILDGGDVTLPVSTFVRLLDLAGVSLKRRVDDEL